MAVGSARLGRGYRLRRKLWRFRNELRAIVSGRAKSGDVDHDPVAINLQITTICNLHCTMCELTFAETPPRVMDHHLYTRVRDELFDVASEVDLTLMGEPFCVPQRFMEELLDDVERYDLRLAITTNATRLGTDEELERVARLTNRIMISCDGATRETFERIRPPAKWDTLKANVERLCRIRRRLPFRQRPLLYFSYVLMRSNLEELPAFVEQAAQWDGYSISVSPLVKVDPSLGDETIDTSDPHVRDVLREAEKRAFETGVGLFVHGPHACPSARRGPWGPKRLMRTVRQWWIPLRPTLTLGSPYLFRKIAARFRVAKRECPYLWYKAFIQIGGEVGTCDSHRFLTTGSAQKTSLREIWRNKIYRGIRNSLNTAHPADACRDCHLLRR